VGPPQLELGVDLADPASRLEAVNLLDLQRQPRIRRRQQQQQPRPHRPSPSTNSIASATTSPRTTPPRRNAQ
jgi:hypothetical protein